MFIYGLLMTSDQWSASYSEGNYFESYTVLHQKPSDNDSNDFLADLIRLGVNSETSDSIIAKHRPPGDGGTGLLESR
jgi:hypothetical protein